MTNLQPRGNPVVIVLASLGLLALAGLPFLRVASNRLVSGEPIYFLSSLSTLSNAQILSGPALLLALVVMAVVAVFASGFVRQGRALHSAVLVATAAFILGQLGWAAFVAQQLMQAQTSLGRVSLGSAFWASSVLMALLANDALQRLGATPLQKGVIGLTVLALLGALLASGWCNDLSIMKEYANRTDGFAVAIGQHLQIVGLAMAFTLGIGLPLGWAAHANQQVAKLVFPALNVVQTIPSIALFGLLMAPLALLAASVPALGALGISGVGMAPAVIALTLYGLLPVVRGTLAGLQQVSTAQINAARALGLKPWAVLRHVRLPLALPVVMGGVRTAAVAAVGLAAVTALIGAGGLGSILFEGLFSNAQDVVLLGVLPIVGLGVLVDVMFSALTAMAVKQAAPHA